MLTVVLFLILEDRVLEVLLETTMVIGCWVFLDFVVLLLAWWPNCMPFFMAFVLRMMRAIGTLFLNQILGWLLI